MKRAAYYLICTIAFPFVLVEVGLIIILSLITITVEWLYDRTTSRKPHSRSGRR